MPLRNDILVEGLVEILGGGRSKGASDPGGADGRRKSGNRLTEW